MIDHDIFHYTQIEDLIFGRSTFETLGNEDPLLHQRNSWESIQKLHPMEQTPQFANKYLFCKLVFVASTHQVLWEEKSSTIRGEIC